jgi:putative tRNA adenosine deaminase-associated protein
MTYFAAVLTRSDDRWTAREVDAAELGELEDSDEIADLLRDAGKPGAPTLLLVEREDEWFGIARLEDDELKIFVSDVYGAAHSELGEVLVPTGEPEPDDSDDSDEGDGASVLIAVPGGDADLMVDLGTSEDELLQLCAHEGLLPGDVLSVIAERAGCGDLYDGLR